MFEITIKQRTLREVPGGNEWRQVGEALLDEEDFRKAEREFPPKNLDEFSLKKVMDYTPKITVQKEVEEIVLQQNVEHLDLVAVIKAISGIE